MPPLPPSTLSQFKLMPFTRVAVGRRRWRQFSPVGRQFNANSGGHFWANLRCTWRWRGHRDLTRTRVYVTCSMKKWWCNIPVCCCCLHKSIDNMAVFFLPIFFPLYLLLLPFFFFVILWMCSLRSHFFCLLFWHVVERFIIDAAALHLFICIRHFRPIRFQIIEIASTWMGFFFYIESNRVATWIRAPLTRQWNS